MRVFWEKGYEATSMQDLVKATGLLKGSLYGAFGDKHTLYMIALEHYDQTIIKSGIDMLAGEGPVTDKIARLFNAVIEASKAGMFSGGCLLCNASVEMAPVDQSVSHSVKNTIKGLKTAVASALKSNIKHANEKEALSGFIICTYLGARVLAKAGAPLQMIEDSRDHCLQMLA